MNELYKAMIDKPPIKSRWCPFCGRAVQSKHHIIPRSQGGKNGPTVPVCGTDNMTGCHGKFHHHKLHLRWSESGSCWQYLKTENPTKYELTLSMSGWKKVHQ